MDYKYNKDNNLLNIRIARSALTRLSNIHDEDIGLKVTILTQQINTALNIFEEDHRTIIRDTISNKEVIKDLCRCSYRETRVEYVKRYIMLYLFNSMYTRILDKLPIRLTDENISQGIANNICSRLTEEYGAVSFKEKCFLTRCLEVCEEQIEALMQRILAYNAFYYKQH